MAEVVSLIVFVTAIAGFVMFVFRWNRFYFYRLEPIIRQKVSDWLGILITLYGRVNSKYYWITPDTRSSKRWQVFGCNLIAAILFGLVPNFLVMLVVGLGLRALGVL